MRKTTERTDILPGTEQPLRGLFVDRWGTLLQMPPGGVPKGTLDLQFHEGAVQALHRAHRAGWRIYLLGNEDAVAFGQMSLPEWERLESTLLAELDGAGVPVARNYAALAHPKGIPGQRGDTVYRLPNTGAFYHAQHHDGISLRASWLVGDSTVEHVAAWRAGLRRAAVRTGIAMSDREYEVDVDLVAKDLCEVVSTLLCGSWLKAA